MTEYEKQDFAGYCHGLTSRQVEGVVEKEKEFADVDPYRAECLKIALEELQRKRGMGA